MAFVGDVHGMIGAVRGAMAALDALGVGRVVFLGDYVNKGRAGAEVIEYLLELRTVREITALRGNHEDALLEAVETGDVAHLLRLGGAPTIRSYVGGNVGPDVGANLREAMPEEHLELLRGMPVRALGADWVASHEPVPPTDRYAISAHRQVGPLPQVGARGAAIDTGCGSGGVLTALLWPSRAYLQVDGEGRLIRTAGAAEASP